MKFSEINVSDAEIRSFHNDLGKDLVVKIRDWREKFFEIRFEGVVAMVAVSPLGEALSHGVEESSGFLIQETIKIIEDIDMNKLSLYSFISAWSEKSIFSVLAENFKIDK